MKRFMQFIVCFLLLTVPGFAFTQLAPVTVSTIATSSGTVTVTTAAAHGLAVNQGFCLSVTVSIPAGLCQVVLTVPTTTTVTFAGNQTCTTACGTIQAAKQIIILQSTEPAPNQWGLTVSLWLTTAQGMAGGKNSAWSGASSAENAALAAGVFVEQSRSYSFAPSLAMATVKAIIQADYTAAQQSIAQSIQPAAYYGVYFNGAWSQ